MIFDSDGKLVDSWERLNDLMVRPHRVVMNPHDAENHVWLVDDGAHQVHKLTQDGEIVMEPEGLLNLKVTASQDESRQRIDIRISWQTEETAKQKKPVSVR